ncbi:trypsin-1-like [Amphibalanus amphitrite]|uniref:trypsin-1-like n=1 Tax=Amphibalanus amphitrite TaxID=1232801 RepID=UPI001C90353E|nr:trypsin-1-like [Amphibalanus amphitrite]
MRLQAAVFLLTIAAGRTVPRRGPAARSVSVIQGETAARGEFPWAAQLKRHGAHVCSAVLVSEQWLVTAAHCLTPDPDTAAYQVIVGEYDVSVDEGSEQTRSVAEVVFSELSDGQNDIALIRVDTPVQLSTYVKTIELPQFEEEFAGKTAVASGWGVSGSTAVGPTFPDRLQKVSLQVLSDADCLDSLVLFQFVPGPMSCARPPPGSSLCWGDSGGALTFYRWSGRPVLAAVTSWGVDCDLNSRPSVFVDVGFFVKWIESVIGK